MPTRECGALGAVSCLTCCERPRHGRSCGCCCLKKKWNKLCFIFFKGKGVVCSKLVCKKMFVFPALFKHNAKVDSGESLDSSGRGEQESHRGMGTHLNQMWAVFLAQVLQTNKHLA